MPTGESASASVAVAGTSASRTGQEVDLEIDPPGDLLQIDPTGDVLVVTPGTLGFTGESAATVID
jgi:hypothetical protein